MKKFRLFGLILLVVLVCLTLTACAKNKLIGITLNTEKAQTEFFVGDAFTYNGLVVTANYSKSESQMVADFTISRPDMTTVGNKTVTVTYMDMTADYQITVSEQPVKPDPSHVLDSITLNTDSVIKSFVVGETFNYDGLVVTGHFKTEPLTQEITTGYTVSTPDMSTAGSKTVTVTYLGKTADYTISVAPRFIQSISLNVTNVKRDYTVNDAFTYQGLVVTANYNAAPLTETVTDYTVNEDELDMSVIGQKTVIVTYQGMMASYEIFVHEPVLILDRIEVNTDNVVTKQFYVGDTFSYEGIVVTAYYENSEPRVITDYTVSEPDMTTAGNKSIIISYQGKTASYGIRVMEPALVRIEVNASGATTLFAVNSEFNCEGIVVTAYYQNRTYKVITEGYTANVEELDMSTPGTKTVIITYQTKTASYDITVTSATLTGIEVNADGATIEFYIGETFSSAGIVVTAHYSDGSSGTVTGYTVSNPDMTTTGTKTVTVTYQGQQDEYTITVADAPVQTFPDVYEGATLYLEAENSVREGNNDVQYTMGRGGAFVGNISNGSKLTFAFKSNVAGTVELYLAITHGNSGHRGAFDVYVNGDKASSFDAVNTGGWFEIKEYLVCKVELKAGLNVIVFDAINTNNEVNVDYLKIAPSTGGNESGNQGGSGSGSGSGSGEGEGGENDDSPSYNGQDELKLEAEKATLTKCTEQNRSTASEGKAVNVTRSGGIVTFTINSTVAGRVKLYFNIASQNLVENAFDVYVNGAKISSLDVQTGAGTKFEEYFAGSVTLNEGENIIEIRVITTGSNVFVDYLRIAPDDSGDEVENALVTSCATVDSTCDIKWKISE